MIKAFGPHTAKICVIGEVPSPEDLKRGIPFSSSGGAGRILENIFRTVGLQIDNTYLTMAAKLRSPTGHNLWFWKRPKGKGVTPPPGFKYSEGLFVRPELAVWREPLLEDLESFTGNVIVPMGEIGLWMLLGLNSITKWRGSTLEWTHPGTGRVFKVIPTHAPEEIMRNWELNFIVTQDFRRIKRESSSPKIHYPAWHFVVRPSFDTTMNYLERLLRLADQGYFKLSVDIETRAGHIACVGLGEDKRHAICIPFMCVENPEGYWSEDEECAIICTIRKLFAHPNTHIIGQNFLYDLQYLIRYWGIKFQMHMDTMLAQHVCFPGMRKALDFISSMYCEFYRYWKDEGKTWDPGIDEEQLWVYNCEDVVNTFECSEVLETVIVGRGVEAPYEQQFRKYPLALETMLQGVAIDLKARNRMLNLLLDARAEVEAWFERVLGFRFNPASPKQMQDVFYRVFNQRPIRKRGTGAITCNDEALQTIAKREPLLRPLCDKISDYRTMGVFLSTFVRASLDTDNRIRCSYALAGTETFRLTSSKDAFGKGTNLQNIPANQAD